MRKKAIIVAMLSFALAAGVVQAETLQERKQQKAENWKAKQKEWQEQKCKRVEERVQNRITRFEEGKVRRMNAYDNLRNRITKIISRAEEKGDDVSKLKEYQGVLNGKITKFEESYKSFIVKLRGSQKYACGNSEGQFRGNLQQARETIKTVQENAQDIKNYVVNTIRPEIKTLKDQKPKTDGNESESGAE